MRTRRRPESDKAAHHNGCDDERSAECDAAFQPEGDAPEDHLIAVPSVDVGRDMSKWTIWCVWTAEESLVSTAAKPLPTLSSSTERCTASPDPCVSVSFFFFFPTTDIQSATASHQEARPRQAIYLPPIK